MHGRNRECLHFPGPDRLLLGIVHLKDVVPPVLKHGPRSLTHARARPANVAGEGLKQARPVAAFHA